MVNVPSSRVTRVTIFAPRSALEALTLEIVRARARKLGYEPRTAEVLREALMRGLVRLRDDEREDGGGEVAGG